MELQLVRPNDGDTSAVAVHTGTAILIKHQEKIVHADVSILNSAKLPQQTDVFVEINKYFNTLPLAVQAEIFKCYSEAISVIREVYNMDMVAKKLTLIVKDLYNLISITDVTNFVRFKCTVRYPPELKTAYGVDDTNKARTYLRSDYEGLVALTVILRPMLPIWGEYISKVTKVVGPRFKEYVAFKLLSLTDVIDCAPLVRLQEYVTSAQSDVPDISSAVMGGLSREQIPEWLLSGVCIRKIAVGNIHAGDASGSIITNVYGYVTNTLNGMDDSFKPIREKHPEKGQPDEERSIIEEFKLKPPTTEGDDALYRHYTMNISDIILGVDPTVEEYIIRECVNELPKMLHDFRILQYHTQFMQWFLDSVIAPQAIINLPLTSQLNMLVAVKALLWHWGSLELALLTTSQPDEGAQHLPGQKRRIPDDLVTLLGIYYPHGRGDITNLRKSNLVYQAINILVDTFSMGLWFVTVPPSMKQTTLRLDNRSRTVTPPNLAELIARAVIYHEQLGEANDELTV